MPCVVQTIAERFENTGVEHKDFYDDLFGGIEEAPEVYEEIIRGEFLTRFLVGMQHAANEYEQHSVVLLDQLNDSMACK